MTRLFIFGPLIAVHMAASVSFAEPLSDYVQECKTALNIGRIPGYSCTDGIFVPSSDGFLIPSSNNYIGVVQTGNEDVDAVFLCRNVDFSNNSAGLNGYILQNRSNGYTCFFDAKEGARANNLPDVDSKDASRYWEDPKDMNGACYACHSNDPYIVSPPLALAFRELQLLYDDRPYLADYRITSTGQRGSHFYEWEQKAQALWQPSSCANDCHRLSDGLITTLGQQLLNEGLMLPAPGSDYDDVAASYLIMVSVSSVW